MDLQDKVVVVTGGANGIGRALCRRFAAEGPRGVVIVDRDGDGVQTLAAELRGRRAVRVRLGVRAGVCQQPELREQECRGQQVDQEIAIAPDQGSLRARVSAPRPVSTSSACRAGVPTVWR